MISAEANQVDDRCEEKTPVDQSEVCGGCEGARSAVLASAKIHMLHLVPALLLCVIGVLITYSVCLPVEGLPERTYWRRQIVYILGGLALYTVLTGMRARIQRRTLLKGAYVIFCVGLLAMVLVVGRSTGNGLRWLSLFGIITVQPSEFAKVALLWVLAECVHVSPDCSRPAALRRQFIAACLIPLPVGLVLLERSMGNSFLLLVCAAAVLLTRWFSWQSLALFMLPLVIAVAVGLVVIAGLRHPTPAINAEKAAAFLGPAYQGRRPHPGLNQRELGSVVTPAGADGLFSHCPSRFSCYLSESGGWNARQALRAIRIGGGTGKGYRKGLVAILGFLPRTVQHTDFAYCVLSEATGAAGASLLIGLLTLLMLLVLRSGSLAVSPAGWSFAIGFAVLLFCQSAIHIGMALRLVPIIGIPLPFVSYGGSSLITLFAGLGIVVRYRLADSTELPAGTGRE